MSEQSSSSNTPPVAEDLEGVSGERARASSPEEEEGEIEAAVEEVVQDEQRTPKGEQHKIPVPEECPPAPRKQPKLAPGSSSSRKRSAESTFFVPPDSVVFSSHSHQRLRLESREQQPQREQVDEEQEQENQQVKQQQETRDESQERVEEQEIQQPKQQGDGIPPS